MLEARLCWHSRKTSDITHADAIICIVVVVVQQTTRMGKGAVDQSLPRARASSTSVLHSGQVLLRASHGSMHRG